MKKKIAFVSSFALASLLVVGQFTYAEKSEGMMNMSENGMMNMMNMNENGMKNMMEAMNSPEGQQMMSSCSEFMETQENK
jgi:hypothetical protein